MKYFILVVFVLLLNGCDFKKVEDGDAPKDATMKCGAGKCGASMMNEKKAIEKKQNKKCGPAVKCGAGKCGDAMK